MSRFTLGYIPRSSPLHTLSGTTKLLVFLLWSILSMAGYDTRIMVLMAAGGIGLFILSGTKIREVSFIFTMLLFFMGCNLVGIYLFNPEQGVAIYGTRHLIGKGLGRFTLTQEQLFYEANVLLKYAVIVPPAILLIVTTDPSEFAASLNRIGVNYAIAYAVSLALRYIPDVQRDYENISQAQQARGIELSRKISWVKRLKGAGAILLPLVFSSLDRIDVVSRAMELRSFGKYHRRTWYAARPFTAADRWVLIVSVLLFILGMWFTFHDGNRFYNPFSCQQV
ncbi:MAG: energy-coupling factor transporter transmembrane protein EcfT [Spirochaetaceae bacterium]|jgi:energy-coupling factor transport system permease protein|nr:energy-coupling factor transporter transmembrane protein EcfT [Spirochaetaceae bacterium]